MCTVLRQHLARTEAIQINGFDGMERRGITPGGASGFDDACSKSGWDRARTTSPPANTFTYSYLRDPLTLDRPVDVYDRRDWLNQTGLKHFHLPYGPDGGRLPARSRSAYIRQLRGRRARSHSRSGMVAMLKQLGASATPNTPRSPHMNNQVPIRLSHYPDARARKASKSARKSCRKKPIERDDFPAPPFAYAHVSRRSRIRPASEPPPRKLSPDDTSDSQVQMDHPVNGDGEDEDDDEDEDGDTMSSDSDSDDVDHGPAILDSSEDEAELTPENERIAKTGAELRKVCGGMCKLLLTEMEADRRKKRQSGRRPLDPRSAARTPGANREPRYRLRYESPVEASPSRIAHHAKPWDLLFWTESIDGSHSAQAAHAVSPNSPTSSSPAYPNYAGSTPNRGPDDEEGRGSASGTRSATLPSRLWTTATASCESDSGRPASARPASGANTNTVRHSSTWGGRSARSERSGTSGGRASPSGGSASGGSTCDGSSGWDRQCAPNAYPLHLLLTTNYRLPGDVDRNNLEKHLTEADFEAVFHVPREHFYRIPHWKRCEIKRKLHLF